MKNPQQTTLEITEKTDKIEIYTDGSCIGNPGPGGWAFLVLDDQQNITFKKSGFASDTTNNRMEMTAIIEALKYLQQKINSQNSAENNTQKPFQIELHSDSNLIVQTINQGWKKKANTDLWLEMDQLLQKVPVKFNWVKAHAQNEFNNLCDQMAQKAAKEQKGR